jgi:outer membrane receptor protein involved in Fe transport
MRYNFLPPVNISGSILNAEIINKDNSVYRQDLYGSYIQGNFDLSPGLSADIGMKLTIAHKRYPVDVKNYILPEPGLGFEYAFNPEVSLKAAYSRNVQYYHGIGVFELLLPFDKYMLADSKLKPQFADHFSSGIFYSPARNQLELSLESFYSFYRNQYRIPVNNDIFFDRDIEYSLESGEISAYGLEVSFRKLSGRFTGIMSYTLSKTLRKEDEINRGSYYYAYYDRRHDLVLSLKQLGFDKKEIDKVTAKLPTDLESTEEKLSWCLSNM